MMTQVKLFKVDTNRNLAAIASSVPRVSYYRRPWSCRDRPAANDLGAVRPGNTCGIYLLNTSNASSRTPKRSGILSTKRVTSCRRRGCKPSGAGLLALSVAVEGVLKIGFLKLAVPR